MKYLLILLVIGLAVAPLTHFLPSKRQRQLARLREYAAVHGLFVEFRDLPGPALPPGDRAKQVIYYGKRLPASRKTPRKRRAWLRDNDGWRGVSMRDPAPAAVAGMPAQILAISEDEGSCGVYWKEDGEEADVEVIVEAVNAWSGAPALP